MPKLQSAAFSQVNTSPLGLVHRKRPCGAVHFSSAGHGSSAAVASCGAASRLAPASCLAPPASSSWPPASPASTSMAESVTSLSFSPPHATSSRMAHSFAVAGTQIWDLAMVNLSFESELRKRQGDQLGNAQAGAGGDQQ